MILPRRGFFAALLAPLLARVPAGRPGAPDPIAGAAGYKFTIKSFRRHLRCRACAAEVALAEAAIDPGRGLAWCGDSCTWSMTCPACRRRTVAAVADRHVPGGADLTVVVPAAEVREVRDPYTGGVDIVWELPEKLKADIRGGRYPTLASTPMDIIATVGNGGGHLRFSPGVCRPA